MRVTVWGLLAVCAFSAQTARQGPPKSGDTENGKIVYRWDVQKSGVNDDLAAVCFVNREVGYAAGKNNTVLKTTDGGATWKPLFEPKARMDFDSVQFASPTDGWVEGPTLLHTADGGESWQPAAPLPGPAGFGGGSLTGSTRFQLHVHNMGEGVFRSDDGGRTWKSAGDPKRNDFEAVFFLNDAFGWVSGDYGRLASTVDGGVTWTAHEPPLQASFTRIQFVSPGTGWLLPRRGHQGGPLATTDGGKTWTSQYAGIETNRPLEDMQFLDAHTGFLLAEANRDSVVLATSNGGKSWRTIGNIAKYSKALSFPYADEGWAVGPKGYLVHYHKVVLDAR